MMMRMMTSELKPTLHVKKYLLVFLILWLSGCMGQVNIPEDRYYRLPEVSPDFSSDILLDKRQRKPGISTLVVERFRMNGIPNTRSILYVDPAHPNELKQYHYRHWVGSPEKLIQASLVSYLGKIGITAYVESANGESSAEYRIKGEIVRFERVMESGGPKVVVKMEVGIESTSINKPGRAKMYQAVIPTSSKSMDETVAAFGEALKLIYQSLVEDIRTGK
jgi:ABC-type uncharacterized transport system auxiliary subunit